jgi:hypothetical protein
MCNINFVKRNVEGSAMAQEVHFGSNANASIEDRRRKLRLISSVAEWVALGGITLAFGYGAYLCSHPEALTAYLTKDIPGVAITPAAGSLIVAGMFSLIPVAIFVAALWEARRLFRLLGNSDGLDPAAPGLLVRLGGLAFAAAVGGIVVRTLVVLAMTIANPPGQRRLFIAIGSNEVSSLIVGLLLFAFALLAQEFLRLESENRSII